MVADFCCAFFCRRGRRDLFLLASFGTFADLVCGRSSGVTPTAAAILPAAAPIFLAAVPRTLSAASSCLSFFFAVSGLILPHPIYRARRSIAGFLPKNPHGPSRKPASCTGI